MKDRLSIKEFSELSNIDASTLRYWDDIGLFSPTCRDSDNNYRYYSPLQVIVVDFITVLRSLGVPLKTIKEMAGKRNPEIIAKLIGRQEKILDKKMAKLRDDYALIHTRLELINRGRVADEKKISIVHQEEMPFILGPRNDTNNNDSIYEPFTKLCNVADEMRFNLDFPIGGYYDDIGSFIKNSRVPSHLYIMDPNGNRTRPAGKYLTAFHRGYYGEFADLPKRMMQYAKDNKLALTSPVYTIYLHDETCLNDSNQYLVQACVAVE